MLTKFIILSLFILGITGLSSAQGERPTIPGVKATTPPKIDGDLSDECWKQAPSVTDFHFLPDGSDAQEPTTARICYDESNVYIAFYCKDSVPGGITTQQKKRGGSLKGDDWVGVDLACYSDRHPIVWFDVSASGVQSENLQSGDASKIEWKGDWTAAAKKVTDGYVVEMAIPFSILQYDPSANTMCVAFLRQHARSYHTWWSPNMGPTGNGEPKNFYLWQGLDLPRPKAKPLVLGYVLSGTGEGGSSNRVGLDIKDAITPTMTAALTANPDFRNVEQAVNSVDFTYTEQFLPDSRPFFQEGGGYFPGSDIFYTRRIEEIDVGAKAYGTYHDFSVAALNARKLGGEDYSVLSLAREWPDKAHINLRGVQSNTASVDNTVGQVSGGYYMYNRNDRKIEVSSGLTLSTLTSAGQSKAYDFGIHGYGPQRTLEWRISHNHIDSDFAPTLGYVPECDIQAWHFSTELRGDFSSGRINHWTTGLYADMADHTDGSLYYDNLSWSGHIHWANGTAGYLDMIATDRTIPDVVGTFHDRYGRLRYKFAANDLYRQTTAQIASGQRAGGDYLYYSVESGCLLTNKVSVRASYGYSRISFPSPLAYSSNQLITTLNYDISNERTLSGRLISGVGKTNIYLVYKQRVRSGMDVYVIYGDPNAESTTNTLLLKLIRPI